MNCPRCGSITTRAWCAWSNAWDSWTCIVCNWREALPRPPDPRDTKYRRVREPNRKGVTL